MEIVQVVGLGFTAAVLLVVLRQQRPDIAVQVSVAVGAILFVFLAGKVMAVVGLLEEIAARARVDGLYMGTVLKIIGIAYVADFGAQVLRDAGEGAVAAKVEMAGKILILVLAVPVIVAILDTVLKLLA